MQKPNNYDNTQASGEFIPIELGGHTAVIMKLEETTSKTGKPMIKVAIEFDQNDVQAGYFRRAYDSDTREKKTWPYQAVQYILTEDAEGKCSRSFKTFISCVEKSNNAECAWGDGFAAWFRGKRVGVVYGEVEEEYNGEVKTRHRIRYFCQYDRAKEASVPDKKYLDTLRRQATVTTPAGGTAGGNIPDGFINVPIGADDMIPF